jgi:hypothetical protein
LAILLRARRPRRPLRRHNRNATGRNIARSATTAIVAAAATAIETAIVETAIATLGATLRGIRAATAVHAAKILGTTVVNPTHAALRVRGNRSATPEASAANCLVKTCPAQTRGLGQTSRPAKTRRLAKTKHPAPAMKLSVHPTNGANAAAEAGADAAVADVTEGKTRATAQGRISLRAKVQPTPLPAHLSPGRESLHRRQGRLLTSAKSVRSLNRLLVSNLP